MLQNQEDVVLEVNKTKDSELIIWFSSLKKTQSPRPSTSELSLWPNVVFSKLQNLESLVPVPV